MRIMDNTAWGDMTEFLEVIRDNKIGGCFLTQSDGVTTADIEELVDALQHNTTLTELYLRGISLSGDQLTQILEATSSNHKFCILDLVNSEISQFNAKKVADVLSKSHLSKLNLSLTNIAKEEGESILANVSEDRRYAIKIGFWMKDVQLHKA